MLSRPFTFYFHHIKKLTQKFSYTFLTQRRIKDLVFSVSHYRSSFSFNNCRKLSKMFACWFFYWRDRRITVFVFFAVPLPLPSMSWAPFAVPFSLRFSVFPWRVLSMMVHFKTSGSWWNNDLIRRRYLSQLIQVKWITIATYDCAFFKIKLV